MKQNDFSLILFDCDGTLLDSEEINAQAMSDILIKLGYQKFSKNYCLKNFIGGSALEIIELLEDLKVDNPEKTLHTMHKRALTLASKELKPVKNAIEILKKIKKKKCVVSNGERKTVLEFLKFTKIISFFKEDEIFTRDQVGKPKPSPDIYLFAAQKMNVNPKQCLVIEDSVTGIKAAKKANMKVLGFCADNTQNDKKEQIAAGADHIIYDLLEILDYI